MSKDKDIKGVCEELARVSDKVVLTRADIPRAEEPEAIRRFFSKAEVTGGVREAMELAEGMAAPRDLILVTGSFFVIGEVLKMRKFCSAGVC
jgi:dihydrofolate synthase/folylpolyglutamate synthase